MGEKEDLRKMFREEFRDLEGKVEKSISRSNNTLLIVVTLFLFIFGGSFAYTNRIADDVTEMKQELRNQGEDLTDIDGALYARYPDSAVFGTRHKREVNKRGN